MRTIMRFRLVSVLSGDDAVKPICEMVPNDILNDLR